MHSALQPARTEQAIRNDDQAYRFLAAAVIRQALEDIQMKGPLPDRAVSNGETTGAPSLEAIRRHHRAAALDFIFAPEYAKTRAMWLAWLDMDERALWNTLARKTFRGGRNAVSTVIRQRLAAVGIAP